MFKEFKKLFKTILFWYLRKDLANLTGQNANLNTQLAEEKKINLKGQEEIVNLKAENEELKKQIIPESDKDRHILNLKRKIKEGETELEKQKMITFQHLQRLEKLREKL